MVTRKNSVIQLETSLNILRQRWEESKDLWDDPIRREFEKRHWQQLEQATRTTLDEMARLAEVLAKAQRHVDAS